MECVQCGFKNRAGVNFCEECGFRLLEAEPAPVATDAESAGEAAGLPPGGVRSEIACSQCGFQSHAGARFCEQCGSSLRLDQKAEATAGLCPECGHAVRPGTLYCEACGASLFPERGPSPPPAPRVQTRKAPARIARYAGIAVTLMAVAASGIWLAGRASGFWQMRSSSAGLAEPGFSLDATQKILEDPALRLDPDVEPWLGFSMVDDDGTLYEYDGTTWSAITPAGDLWGPPGSTAAIVETATEIRLTDVAVMDAGWVRELLEGTPGLSPAGGNFSITDFTLYRDGFIEAASDRGVRAIGTGEGSIALIKPAVMPYVWVEPADDHVWFIDNTAAVLMVEANEELAFAGRLVPDVIRGAVWQPAPDSGILSGSVSQVFTEIDGAVEEGGGRHVPFKVFIPGEVPPIRVDKIPSASGPIVEVRKYEAPKEKCSWWKCVKEAVGSQTKSAGSGLASGFERGWNGTVNATGSALDRVDLDTLACLGGEIICQLQTAGSVASGTADVAEALWQVRGNIFAEKECDGGSPGPGRGPSGDPANHAYPVETEGYSLDGIYTPFTKDWPEQLALARLWMPLLEFSKDERCGEILRVFAKLHAYGPDGDQANSLDRAVRVEIVYTLFFKQDGGRFQLLGADHPGDNEGFVVGLVRTAERTGRCSSGFEFVAGRSVGHSEKGGWLVRYIKANARQIDDFDTSDIGTGCPGLGDASYRLLIAEAKHAPYYHREVCEAALVPNLPALALGFASGGSLGGLTADTLMKLAPDAVKRNLQNGLEECESGRDLLDLSARVELFSEELREVHADELGFGETDTYQTEEGPKPFEEAARGRWCFGPDASSLPRYPDCAYDYHVPGFFDYRAAEPGVTVPPLKNLTEQQANAEVEARGLSLVVTPQMVDHINAAGRVLTQNPEAGSVVAPGTRVTVRVGVYDEVSVPDLYRSTPEQARALIEAQGFVYVFGGTVALTDEEASLDGFIVDQDPVQGSQAVPGTQVRVYVGSYTGPSMVPVPSLVGKTESQARALADARGLSIRVAGMIPGDASDAGLVVDQDPWSGSMPEGGMLDVWLGSVSTVAVPDLGGLTQSEARSRVEQNGLVFQVAGTSISSGSMAGRVVAQEPTGGMVDEGTTIRVWIGVAIDFPAQETSNWVAVSITGGHGSLHEVGENVDLCFGWATLAGEPAGQWQLWDFQPPESSGVMLREGSMLSAGSDCISATITGPAGYDEIVVAALEFDYGSNSWRLKDVANVMIYVVE